MLPHSTQPICSALLTCSGEAQRYRWWGSKPHLQGRAATQNLRGSAASRHPRCSPPGAAPHARSRARQGRGAPAAAVLHLRSPMGYSSRSDCDMSGRGGRMQTCCDCARLRTAYLDMPAQAEGPVAGILSRNASWHGGISLSFGPSPVIAQLSTGSAGRPSRSWIPEPFRRKCFGRSNALCMYRRSLDSSKRCRPYFLDFPGRRASAPTWL